MSNLFAEKLQTPNVCKGINIPNDIAPNNQLYILPDGRYSSDPLDPLRYKLRQTYKIEYDELGVRTEVRLTPEEIEEIIRSMRTIES